MYPVKVGVILRQRHGFSERQLQNNPCPKFRMIAAKFIGMLSLSRCDIIVTANLKDFPVTVLGLDNRSGKNMSVIGIWQQGKARVLYSFGGFCSLVLRPSM